MSRRWKYYGKGLPYRSDEHWPGHLIVMEGADGAGRSTQVSLLKPWLESQGHAVVDTGLRRSSLMSEMISRARQGNVLGRTTLSLLYATDLADRLENGIIPALRAGFVVLADRYIFTVMARDLVRGAARTWLEELFGFALVPDLTIYLHTSPEDRLHRALGRYGVIDYWESGMDLGLSGDRFESFLRYQELLQQEYDRMAAHYDWVTVDGTAPVLAIHRKLQSLVQGVISEGRSDEVD